MVRNSGSVGDYTSISKGSHELRIEVSSADEYGVEIDKCELSFSLDCDTNLPNWIILI